MPCADLQVHQLQQDHDSAVLHPGALCQGPGWVLRHVHHHLPGLHPAGLPALRVPGQGLQHLPERLVSVGDGLVLWNGITRT